MCPCRVNRHLEFADLARGRTRSLQNQAKVNDDPFLVLKQFVGSLEGPFMKFAELSRKVVFGSHAEVNTAVCN